MADPSRDLQKAIVSALKASPEVDGLVGDRIYDHVPDNAVFPYVTYGSDQVLADKADCVNGFEVFTQIDVWTGSESVGQPEMKRIAGIVREAIDEQELVLDEHAFVLIEHDNTQYLDDPDGVSHHAAVTFRSLVEFVPP